MRLGWVAAGVIEVGRLAQTTSARPRWRRHVVLAGPKIFSRGILALLIAGAGFLGIYLIPYLKPSGQPARDRAPGTIQARGFLYLAMVVISVLSLASAMFAARRLTGRYGHVSFASAGPRTLDTSARRRSVDRPRGVAGRLGLSLFGRHASRWRATPVRAGSVCSASRWAVDDRSRRCAEQTFEVPRTQIAGMGVQS